MALDIPSLAHWIANIYYHAELGLLERAAQETQQLGIQPETYVALRQLAAYEQHANYILSTAHRQAIHDMHQLIEDAVNEGIAEAALDLQLLGHQARIMPLQQAIIENIAHELTTSLQQLHYASLRHAVDAFREVQAIATGQIILGALTRQQATQYALDEFARRGITMFVDKSGRKWSADTYAEMAVRTGTMRAQIDGRLNMYDSNGYDLVLVSDSPRECSLCRPWEHKVLTISGQPGTHTVPDLLTGGTTIVDVVATVDEARADGLLHPNCTHDLRVYVPGATADTDTVDDPQLYELTQEQRYIERNIRLWERRRVAAILPPERDTAERKLLEWEARLDTLIDSHSGLRRRPERENPFTAR